MTEPTLFERADALRDRIEDERTPYTSRHLVGDMADLLVELASALGESPAELLQGQKDRQQIRRRESREERLERGLKAAWEALKWKRMDPLDQIDEARDIIDDTLQRPRINGVKAKLGDPVSRYHRYE